MQLSSFFFFFCHIISFHNLIYGFGGLIQTDLVIVLVYICYIFFYPFLYFILFFEFHHVMFWLVKNEFQGFFKFVAFNQMSCFMGLMSYHGLPFFFCLFFFHHLKVIFLIQHWFFPFFKTHLHQLNIIFFLNFYLTREHVSHS